MESHAVETIGSWDIDEGISDPGRFFQLVPVVFPQATHLFVEGTSMAPDARACYAEFAEEGPFLPGRQTIWPRSRVFRCVASGDLFQRLSELAALHAASEMLDHLSLYSGTERILEWHDAFANAILLDGGLPETAVRALAEPFGVAYGRVP